MTGWREEEELREWETEFGHWIESKNNFVVTVSRFCLFVIGYLRRFNEKLD